MNGDFVKIQDMILYDVSTSYGRLARPWTKAAITTDHDAASRLQERGMQQIQQERDERSELTSSLFLSCEIPTVACLTPSKLEYV